MEIKLNNSVVTAHFKEIKKHQMFVLNDCLYIRIDTLASGGNINAYNLSTSIGSFISHDTEVIPVKKLAVEY